MRQGPHQLAQKYTTTGVKDIRIMTENGSISISHILVLEGSTSPPGSFEDFKRMIRGW